MTVTGDPNLQHLTALILAGGLGTRLRAVLSDRPKPLAEVNGRPFLTYLLDTLVQAGLTQAILCTGYRGEQMETALGNHYQTLHLSYSRETTPLGTAGALRLALPLIQTEAVLVLNGDSYCQCDLEAFWAWSQSRQTQLSLVLTQVEDSSRYGRVTVDKTGAITQFAEKQLEATGPGWINAGIYLLSRQVIEEIPPDKTVSLEREVFPRWIGRGLYGYQGGGQFVDIGTPESYQSASRLFSSGERL